jgi:hypothetical protein
MRPFAVDSMTSIGTLLIVVHPKGMPKLVNYIAQVGHAVAPSQIHLSLA